MDFNSISISMKNEKCKQHSIVYRRRHSKAIRLLSWETKYQHTIFDYVKRENDVTGKPYLNNNKKENLQATKIAVNNVSVVPNENEYNIDAKCLQVSLCNDILKSQYFTPALAPALNDNKVLKLSNSDDCRRDFKDKPYLFNCSLPTIDKLKLNSYSKDKFVSLESINGPNAINCNGGRTISANHNLLNSDASASFLIQKAKSDNVHLQDLLTADQITDLSIGLYALESSINNNKKIHFNLLDAADVFTLHPYIERSDKTLSHYPTLRHILKNL